jgi:hypothetical protein
MGAERPAAASAAEATAVPSVAAAADATGGTLGTDAAATAAWYNVKTAGGLSALEMGMNFGLVGASCVAAQGTAGGLPLLHVSAQSAPVPVTETRCTTRTLTCKKPCNHPTYPTKVPPFSDYRASGHTLAHLVGFRWAAGGRARGGAAFPLYIPHVPTHILLCFPLLRFFDIRVHGIARVHFRGPCHESGAYTVHLA